MNIIRELRKKKGVQQKELSIAIGVSQPTVSDWEKNKKDPSGENLKKLADFFGVDELIIMGRGVIDLTQDISAQNTLTKNVEGIPKTIEAKIISDGVDKMTKAQREQVLAVVKAMFANHPELFEEGDNNDT
jgi:transcriptional regulator with XRE-family HTH domain